MNKILLLIFLCLHFFNVLGQDVWNQYNTVNTGDNGLVGDFVYGFLNDGDNTLWIGTAYGITLYDGTNWRAINSLDGLRVDEVEDLEMDSNQNIWIGYGSYIIGVSKYDGTGFTHYTEEDGLINNKVNDILIDSNDNVWFATNAGISVFDGVSWTSYSEEDGLLDTEITSLAQDIAGDIWIGTGNAGTYILQNNSISPFSWEANSTDRIQDLYIDQSGNVWVAGDLTYKYDGVWTSIPSFEPGKFGVVWDINGDELNKIFFSTSEGFTILDGNNYTYYYTEDNLPSNNVFSSFVKNDTIWIGTEGGAAILVNNIWTKYTTNDGGLISNDVNSVFEDSNDNLWFCTQGGISSFNGSTWESYKNVGDNYQVKWVSSGIQDSDGDFWFGTLNGIFKYDLSTWEVFDWTVDNIFSGWVQDVMQDTNGNIWFASSNYLLKYDGVDWTHYNDTSGFQSEFVETLFEDSSGRIWIGSRAGISYYENDKFTHFLSGIDFSNSTPVYDIFEDKDGQVHAVLNTSVLIFKNDQWEQLPIGAFRFSDGFCDNSNQIWFTTYFGSGIVKYKNEDWENITTSDSLSSNTLRSIIRTKNGIFYISTDKGVTEITPNIQISDPQISVEDSLNNINTLIIESTGITSPYWFSLDGINYEQNNGVYSPVPNSSQIAYVTNGYDTLQVEYCINTYNKIDESSCGPYLSPSKNLEWVASGIYTDIITNSVGCDSIISVNLRVDECILQIEESVIKDLDVYPNPTTGIVNIKPKHIDEINSMQVFDQIGKTVLHRKRFANDHIILELEGSKGLYFIKVIYNSGKEEIIQVMKK
ncbi:MAG: two-component regulator propeller domain-containing protein [Bacteroidota bacterium]